MPMPSYSAIWPPAKNPERDPSGICNISSSNRVTIVFAKYQLSQARMKHVSPATGRLGNCDVGTDEMRDLHTQPTQRICHCASGRSYLTLRVSLSRTVSPSRPQVSTFGPALALRLAALISSGITRRRIHSPVTLGLLRGHHGRIPTRSSNRFSDNRNGF